MFAANTKTVSVGGQEVLLKEMSAEAMFNMPENADMALVVHACWGGPEEVTVQQVRSWPMSIVKELYDHCVDVCGLDEGNG